LWLGSWDRINLKKIKPKQNIKLNSQQIKILNNKIKKNQLKKINSSQLGYSVKFITKLQVSWTHRRQVMKSNPFKYEIKIEKKNLK
jgi:hypothetical protein